MENVKKFYDALANDKGLQEKAIKFNAKYKGEPPSDDEAKAELISFAKAEGYEFTMAEFDAYSKKAQPVSDEVMEMVAGGAFNKNNCFCALGGGGKDPETGRTCACVVSGGGKADNEGSYLCCVAAGWIDKSGEGSNSPYI